MPASALTWAVGLFFVAGEPSPAPEPPRSDVEEELFGAPPGGAPSAARVPTSTAGGMAEAIEATLTAVGERFAIGGELFLRIEYRALARGRAERFAVVSPSTFDLYVDARPIERVRTYARARLAYDFTASGEAEEGGLETPPSTALGGAAGRVREQVFLDQLWAKFDAFQSVFFTVGKQRVRWGTGRIWNPTDFLNVQRFDPLALFDPRLGVSLIKVHIPFEEAGANVYAIANLEGAERLDRVGGALRAEIAFETIELALSGAARSGDPLLLGADASFGLGPFELRAELAVLTGVETPFFRGSWSVREPFAFERLRVVYRDDELIPQLVLGGDVTLDYGDGDQAILGVEYFYNDAGYDDAGLYPLLLLAPGLPPTLQGAIGLREPSPPLFQPLYLGRHYLSAFALFPAPFTLQDHTFTITAITNLSDRSIVARLDHNVRLLPFLNLRSYVNGHLGDRGELRLGFEVPAVPPVLAQPLRLVPPAFQVGMALVTSL